jgi:hypothetical protein
VKETDLENVIEELEVGVDDLDLLEDRVPVRVGVPCLEPLIEPV